MVSRSRFVVLFLTFGFAYTLWRADIPSGILITGGSWNRKFNTQPRAPGYTSAAKVLL
jgi:hypothetical protein